MTGQQKSGTNMYSTGSPYTQQKGEEKGITYTKNRFQQPPKKTKSFKKNISTRRPHSWTKENVKANK